MSNSINFVFRLEKVVKLRSWLDNLGKLVHISRVLGIAAALTH